MEKTDLVEKMKVVLATSFSFALKAQNYHWNVTGINFRDHHKFFGKLYEEVYSSIDEYAEIIRQLGAFTPGSLKRFNELTLISDELAIPSPKFMFVRLAGDNKVLLEELKSVRAIANELNEIAAVVTLENWIQFHQKMQWMLESYADE